MSESDDSYKGLSPKSIAKKVFFETNCNCRHHDELEDAYDKGDKCKRCFEYHLYWCKNLTDSKTIQIFNNIRGGHYRLFCQFCKDKVKQYSVTTSTQTEQE